jgi:hypothetical protein
MCQVGAKRLRTKNVRAVRNVADVGLVDSIDSGTGTPPNICVSQVIARGGGRGIVCVSESGGLVIDRIDIADTVSNSILLENCCNVNIANVSGSVTRGGDIRSAARTEFANSSDITIQNLTVTNSASRKTPARRTAPSATTPS